MKKAPHIKCDAFELGYKDSNLEMTESESVALPFGDTPKIFRCTTATNDIISNLFKKCKYFFNFFYFFF